MPNPDRKLNAEELGQRLLRLLENWRVLSLSLHNAAGDLLWLNQGVFGPDEHGQVLDALDLFALEADRQFLERKLDDGRRALFLGARTPSGERCGVALAVVQARSRQNRDSPFVWTPGVEAVMQRFSALLAPVLPGSAAAPEPGTTHKAGVRRSSGVDEGVMHARRYARLRSGGSTRRYELSRATGTSADEDTAAVTRLTEYLAHQRQRFERQPVSFTVPVSVASVLEPHFIASLEVSLQVAEIQAAQIGFCVAATVWNEQRPQVERFAAECARIGCFVTLDDFVMSEAGLALLRSPSIRCLKLQAQLTADAMTDKYSQAMLAAIVQATRVLGLYCVAKNVESGVLAKWLARAGVEFVDNLNRAAAESQSLQQVS